MDLSLFKESISQHSANLKGDAEMSAFNKAIIRANYYSESTMVHIENTINEFKENFKHSSDITLISEGVKDIGKAMLKVLSNGKLLALILIISGFWMARPFQVLQNKS